MSLCLRWKDKLRAEVLPNTLAFSVQLIQNLSNYSILASFVDCSKVITSAK